MSMTRGVYSPHDVFLDISVLNRVRIHWPPIRRHRIVVALAPVRHASPRMLVAKASGPFFFKLHTPLQVGMELMQHVASSQGA